MEVGLYCVEIIKQSPDLSHNHNWGLFLLTTYFLYLFFLLSPLSVPFWTVCLEWRKTTLKKEVMWLTRDGFHLVGDDECKFPFSWWSIFSFTHNSAFDQLARTDIWSLNLKTIFWSFWKGKTLWLHLVASSKVMGFHLKGLLIFWNHTWTLEDMSQL